MIAKEDAETKISTDMSRTSLPLNSFIMFDDSIARSQQKRSHPPGQALFQTDEGSRPLGHDVPRQLAVIIIIFELFCALPAPLPIFMTLERVSPNYRALAIPGSRSDRRGQRVHQDGIAQRSADDRCSSGGPGPRIDA